MKNNVLYAFPRPLHTATDDRSGMTLCDYFAAKVMTKVLDKTFINDLFDLDKNEIKEAVSKCYDIAEAMVVEKMKREK